MTTNLENHTRKAIVGTFPQSLISHGLKKLSTSVFVFYNEKLHEI
ncbi:hypothetical protein [Acinetobacter sp. ANC 4910]|nr:hypothetical protein [Acinetobacter sp. ANC 4910]